MQTEQSVNQSITILLYYYYLCSIICCKQIRRVLV